MKRKILEDLNSYIRECFFKAVNFYQKSKAYLAFVGFLAIVPFVLHLAKLEDSVKFLVAWEVLLALTLWGLVAPFLLWRDAEISRREFIKIDADIENSSRASLAELEGPVHHVLIKNIRDDATASGVEIKLVRVLDAVTKSDATALPRKLVSNFGHESENINPRDEGLWRLCKVRWDSPGFHAAELVFAPDSVGAKLSFPMGSYLATVRVSAKDIKLREQVYRIDATKTSCVCTPEGT